MKIKHLLLSLMLVPAVTTLRANISLNSAPYNDQDQTGDTLKDSSGNDLSPSFVAALGFFKDDFLPSSENIGDWQINWEGFTFGFINTTNPPTTEPRFNLQSTLFQDGSSSDNATADFRNQSAWLWVYNNQNAYAPGAEWFLARVSTWMFPDPPDTDCPTCPGDFEILWAISQFTTEIPVWGRQSAYEGAGFNYATSDDFSIQTYVVIPEPGALFLMLTAFSAAAFLFFLRKGDAQ